MRLCFPQQYRRRAKVLSKFTGQWILADFFLSNAPLSRLGITVTRRFGASHQRNHFKRLVREAFRLASPFFNCDIVIRPRSAALHASFQDIYQELLLFINKSFPST